MESMDFDLARMMDALGSDVVLRRRNLLNLLSSLNLHEQREVARFIASLDFRTDIVARLPPELHLHLAAHVDKADVPSFLSVSKTWRTIWSEDKMIRILMPDLWEYQREEQETASSRQNLQLLFFDTCRRRRIRSQGKYRSFLKSTYSLENDEFRWHPQQCLDTGDLRPTVMYPEFLYSNGRVAWETLTDQSRHTDIIVDDLKSQLRKAYTVPKAVMLGDKPKLLAVGNKLVVAGRNRTLDAWDLETNDHSSITLPSSLRPLFFKTYGNEVYAYPNSISRTPSSPNPQIYVWKFQQRVRELDIRSLLEALQQLYGDRKWYCNGIISHPLRSETIFVVCQDENDVVSVHKYTQGVYCSSQYFTAPPEGKWGGIDRRYSERLMPMTSYGGFAVALFGFCRPRPKSRVVCFDTLREVFSVEEYTIHGGRLPVPADVTLWGSEVVLFDQRTGKACLVTADRKGPSDISPASNTVSAIDIRLRRLVDQHFFGVYERDRIDHQRYHSMQDRDTRVCRRPPLLFADEDFLVIRGSYSSHVNYLVLSTDAEFRKVRPDRSDGLDERMGEYP